MANNATPNSPMHDTAVEESANNSSRLRRMLGLSLHAWENLVVVSLALAGVIALVVGVATFCVVRLQRAEISESKAEFERYKVDAGEKISAAEAVGKTAQAEMAKANAKIAEATVRTKQAELKLEELRSPRIIRSDPFLAVLGGMTPVPVKILFLRDAPDGANVAAQLSGLLSAAGWQQVTSEPIPTLPSFIPESMLPFTQAAGGRTSGITVVTGGVASSRLLEALRFSLVGGEVFKGMNSDAASEEVRIVIGPKP